MTSTVFAAAVAVALISAAVTRYSTFNSTLTKRSGPYRVGPAGSPRVGPADGQADLTAVQRSVVCQSASTVHIAG